MLHRPIHLAAVFFGFECLSLVKLFLTFAEGEVHLGAPMLIEEHEQGDDGVTSLLGSTLKTCYLAPVEQEFAVALGLMVVIGAIEIGGDVHSLHPYLTIVDVAEGIHQTGFAETDRFYLGACEHDTCRVSLDEEILKRGFLIADVHRTLLSYQFLFLVHLLFVVLL